MLINSTTDQLVVSFNNMALKATSARMEADPLTGDLQAIVRLYNTDILVFSNLDGGTILVCAGEGQLYNKATTRRRINQAAAHFGLPISVRSDKNVFTIDVAHEGKEFTRRIEKDVLHPYHTAVFTADPRKW